MKERVTQGELDLLFRNRLSEITYAWSATKESFAALSHKFLLNFSKAEVLPFIDSLEKCLRDSKNISDVITTLEQCLKDYKYNPEKFQDIFIETQKKLENIAQSNINIQQITETKDLQMQLFAARKHLADFHHADGAFLTPSTKDSLTKLLDKPMNEEKRITMLSLAREIKELENTQSSFTDATPGIIKRNYASLITSLQNVLAQMEKQDPNVYNVIQNLVVEMVSKPSMVQAQKFDQVIRDGNNYNDPHQTSAKLQEGFAKLGVQQKIHTTSTIIQTLKTNSPTPQPERETPSQKDEKKSPQKGDQLKTDVKLKTETKKRWSAKQSFFKLKASVKERYKKAKAAVSGKIQRLKNRRM